MQEDENLEIKIERCKDRCFKFDGQRYRKTIKTKSLPIILLLDSLLGRQLA